MQDIFRYYDSYLEDTVNRYELKGQMEDNVKELVTWGVLIYNRNTRRDGQMYKMQRSKNNIVKQLAKKKI